MKAKELLVIVSLLFSTAGVVCAQYQSRVITTAAPFLTYSPDARAAAMGECGVATDADAFSMYYNPAKYAFMEKHTVIASGFDFWMNYYVSPLPMNLYNAFAQKIGRSAIAVTARYYTAGEIEIVDEHNQSLGTFSPHEFAADAAYSYRFGDYLSAGLAARFIYSKLTPSFNDSKNAGMSIAGDIGVYYNRPLGRVVDLSLGASITNIGTKMNYFSYSDKKDFIPTTMRLGAGVKVNFHPKHSLAFNVQFSKLLVPTPPIRNMQTGEVIYGYDDNVSVVAGILHSFYDAPGYSYNPVTGGYDNIGKFYEELCEINTGIGLEYNLADHFFVRNGFYHRPALKGGENYLCSGLGMHFGIFGMDVSLNTPIYTKAGTNYYSSVIRWNMYFDF